MSTGNGSARPIRLWRERKKNSRTQKKESKWVPHRCFTWQYNAHLGAIEELMWETVVGTTIAVIDMDNLSREIGTYKRTVNGWEYDGVLRKPELPPSKRRKQ